MSLKIVYFIQLLDAFSMSFLIPLINSRITSLGGSLLMIGVISSASAGAQLFGSPVIGSWSDRRGRKSILLYTLFATLLSNILIGIPSLSMFFISRFLYGASHQTDVLVGTIITDTVSAEDVTSSFSKIGAIFGLAFMFGPVLGGVLYDQFQSYYFISIILCVLNVLLIILVQLKLKESVKPKREEKTLVQKTFLESLSEDMGKVFKDLVNINWNKYGDLLLTKFFAEAAFNMLFMNMGFILMEKFMFSQLDMGLVFSFISVITIVFNLALGSLVKILYKSDSTGVNRNFHGYLIVLIGTLFLPFVSTSFSYLAFVALAAIGKVLLDSALMEILSSKTTETDKGVIMGANTSMISLSGLVCPLVSGVVGNYLGISPLASLPIFPSIAGILMANYLKNSSRNNKDKES